MHVGTDSEEDKTGFAGLRNTTLMLNERLSFTTVELGLKPELAICLNHQETVWAKLEEQVIFHDAPPYLYRVLQGTSH